VANAADLYIEAMARDLRGSAGFTWTNWSNAAGFAMTLEKPEQAVEWAQAAVSAPGIGQANFQTLTTLAMAQSAAGDADASRETLEQAMAHPTANALLIHGLGRQLLSQERRDDAVWVWEKNAEMHPGEWPVEVGLMRGHSAMGDYDQAVAHGRKALEQAPDDLNRQNLESLIPRLEAGEDIN
jgi:Flp pilus assembly protein TadD